MQSFAFPVSGMLGARWWNLIISVRLIQVGNNGMTISGTIFRCPRPLNRVVRLIQVSLYI